MDRRAGSLKGRCAALVALCMAVMVPITAWAASRPINKVSVRVDSKLEAGSTLPDIGIGDGSPEKGGVRVNAGNSKYHVSDAEWLNKGSGKELKAADEPQMRVTLEPEDVSEDYFLASYKESDVKISGGSFVSARRDGDSLVVTLRVKAIKGDYDAPKDAYWFENNLGEARWEKPENTSGHYELQLYRGKKSVYKVPDTTATKYNFYPYMTEAGEYMFKIRTIPGTDEQKKYGGKSDWLESGDLEITDRYVSDGKGQQKKDGSVSQGTALPVGWNQNPENGQWSWRFPDGSVRRGGWEYINGYWYYFNMDGVMLTGWQQIGDQRYFLHGEGAMAVGWTRIDNKWYYFYTAADQGYTEGTMTGPGWQAIGSWHYYFNADGSMYTGWLEQNGKWYYLNELDNRLQGAMFTGWMKRDHATYYMNSNGERLEGWYEIDGSWYYFYPGTGVMAVSTNIDGFYVDEYGVMR